MLSTLLANAGVVVVVVVGGGGGGGGVPGGNVERTVG